MLLISSLKHFSRTCSALEPLEPLASSALECLVGHNSFPASVRHLTVSREPCGSGRRRGPVSLHCSTGSRRTAFAFGRDASMCNCLRNIRQDAPAPIQTLPDAFARLRRFCPASVDGEPVESPWVSFSRSL